MIFWISYNSFCVIDYLTVKAQKTYLKSKTLQEIGEIIYQLQLWMTKYLFEYMFFLCFKLKLDTVISLYKNDSNQVMF